MKLTFPDQLDVSGEALPNFSAPPVVETSVGIQFNELPKYTSLLSADFWRSVQAEYPVVEEHRPLEPAFETFGPGNARINSPKIQILEGAVQPRFFFISSDGTELVQLQKDRLFYNWRRVTGSEIYPRYPYVRDKLRDVLAKLSAWAERNKLGPIQPTQCEAVYVNKIPLKGADGASCGLSHIFPWFAGLQGLTEDGNVNFRRRLNDDEGKPAARLSFSLRYGTDETGAREAIVTLSVRGQPKDTSINGCLDMIDAEREVIVRTFTEVTSSSAHEIWGKIA